MAESASGSQTALQQLYRQATDATTRSDIPPAVEERIDEQWEIVHGGPFDVTQPTSFGPYLVQFLRRRAKDTPPDQVEDRLCGGSLACRARRGRLPAALQQPRGRLASSPSLTPESTARYLQDNPRCHAVSDALEQYRTGLRETQEALQTIISLARQGGADVDIEPERVPATDVPSSDGDGAEPAESAETEREPDREE